MTEVVPSADQEPEFRNYRANIKKHRVPRIDRGSSFRMEIHSPFPSARIRESNARGIGRLRSELRVFGVSIFP